MNSKKRCQICDTLLRNSIGFNLKGQHLCKNCTIYRLTRDYKQLGFRSRIFSPSMFLAASDGSWSTSGVTGGFSPRTFNNINISSSIK